MKRKLILGLVTMGTAAMLCGFDSAETADSILQKANEAQESLTDVAMNMAVNADVAINLGDGTNVSTIAVNANGAFDIEAAIDPLAMSMDGSMKVSLMGQAMELTMKMYGVTSENGNFDVYTYTEDSTSSAGGAWSHETTPGVNINDLKQASEQFAQLGTLADWGIAMELAPAAEVVDGAECYVLSTTIDANTFQAVIDKLTELAGQEIASSEEVAMAMVVLNGIKLNLVEYVDTTTYLPVKLHMDMNGTDMSMINEMLGSTLAASMGGEGTTATLDLNDLSFDYTVDYSKAVSITVPAEALAAAM